jgi:hypothetical protein
MVHIPITFWCGGCGVLGLESSFFDLVHPCPVTWQVWCEGCGATDDDGERMVACDECGVWKHTRCCGIPDDDDEPASFKCSNCQKFDEPNDQQNAVRHLGDVNGLPERTAAELATLGIDDDPVTGAGARMDNEAGQAQGQDGAHEDAHMAQRRQRCRLEVDGEEPQGLQRDVYKEGLSGDDELPTKRPRLEETETEAKTTPMAAPSNVCTNVDAVAEAAEGASQVEVSLVGGGEVKAPGFDE